MPSLLSIARMRLPSGLAARAVLFTATLVSLSAGLSACAVAFGVQRLGLMAFFAAPAILTLGAAWLTARVASRALAPLDALTLYAKNVGEHGRRPAPIEIEGDDEIGRLGAAINTMMARVARSARRLQEAAFIDAATQLPNHDRFALQIERAQKAQVHKTPAEAGASLFVFELRRLPKLLQTLDAGAGRELLGIVAKHVRGGLT